jgi:hypothetical protein
VVARVAPDWDACLLNTLVGRKGGNSMATTAPTELLATHIDFQTTLSDQDCFEEARHYVERILEVAQLRGQKCELHFILDSK